MKRPTDDELRRTQILLSFTAGASLMGMAVLILLTFTGRLACQ